MPTRDQQTMTERNPVVVIVGSAVGLVQAILVVVALAVEWGPTMQAAVGGVVTAAATFAVAVFTQGQYTTPYDPGVGNTIDEVRRLRSSGGGPGTMTTPST